jgi:hypothetical protein
MAFQKVEVPAGNFMGWSNTKPGQVVEGKILDYSETDGRDYAKEPCPLLTIELSRKATSVNKNGDRTTYEPGDELSITAGQANLKKSIKKADRDIGLRRGFLARVELVSFERVPDGTVKVFEVQVDSSTGEEHASHDGNGDSGSGGDDDEPPF